MSDIHKNWKKFLKEETFVDDPDTPQQSSLEKDAAARNEGRVIRSIIAYLEELKQAQPAFDTIIETAEEEYNTWRGFDNPIISREFFLARRGRRARPRRLGKDTAPPGRWQDWPAHERLEAYWSNLNWLGLGNGIMRDTDYRKHYSYENDYKARGHYEGNDENGNPVFSDKRTFLGTGITNQVPWSAAFISYVMRTAREGQYGFRFSGGHRAYKSRGNKTKNTFVDLVIEITERLAKSSDMNYVLDARAEKDLADLAYKYMSFDVLELGGYKNLLLGDLACKDVFNPDQKLSTIYNLPRRGKERIRDLIRADARVRNGMRTSNFRRVSSRTMAAWEFTKEGYNMFKITAKALIVGKARELSAHIDKNLAPPGSDADADLNNLKPFIPPDKLEGLVIKKFLGTDVDIGNWVSQNVPLDKWSELNDVIGPNEGSTDEEFDNHISGWFEQQEMQRGTPVPTFYQRLRYYTDMMDDFIEEHGQSTYAGRPRRFFEGAHDGHCDICTETGGTAAIGGNLGSTVKRIDASDSGRDQQYILTRNVEHKISYLKNIYSDVLARKDLSDVPDSQQVD